MFRKATSRHAQLCQIPAKQKRPTRGPALLSQSTFHSERKSQDQKPSLGPCPDTSLLSKLGNRLSFALPSVFSVPNGLPDIIPNSTLLGAALTALVGLGVVSAGGVIYVKWYKSYVLNKMARAFEPGFETALQLINHGSRIRTGNWDPKARSTDLTHVDWASEVPRDEQGAIDAIVHGVDHGHYFLLMGPKGVGKKTMILDAMRRVEAEGIAICEAHEDLEVFRLRLGKALNYEFSEDSQTSLFHRRDPREGGPRLDIERALNKLQQMALRTAPTRRKPLVLVINDIQHLDNDEESHKLIQQIQQKAESWAESHLITVVLTSDDFWPYPLMRQLANRLRVISVGDLRNGQSVAALRHLRRERQGKAEEYDVLRKALDLCGGRLSHVNHLARSNELFLSANEMLELKTGWLLSKIGLIPDCDEAALDDQKRSVCAWLLLREFVRQYREKEAQALAMSAESGRELEEVELPAIPYYRVRQIMARADILERLDHLNIVAIDTNHVVRPDSMVLLRAAINVVEEEGFDKLLDDVRDRIGEIESLRRTRELTWKASPHGDHIQAKIEQPLERI